LRRVLDAIFYGLRSGCAWRLLPHEFPPWRSVYYWLRKRRIDGTFERLNAAFVARATARALGEKRPTPSAGIVDSQSAKTTGVGGEQRGGYDGGKKVRGILGVICWWTPKVWFSKPRSTAQRSPTPRWANATAEGRQRAFSTPLSSVGGCRLPQGTEAKSGHSSTAWLKCRGSPASHTQANTREDSKDLGRGVGQGR
jgi:transposase